TALSVNLPTLTPGVSSHSQRIAHLHTNTPGVLADLNQIFAEHDVNVGGQVLATRDQTGYVVTDTDSPLSAQVLADLRSVTETVRLRVID
ncbi:MAG: phosphoglycerate dehydrogenase, partial [Nocardioidaceae bacterium]